MSVFTLNKNSAENSTKSLDLVNFTKYLNKSLAFVELFDGYLTRRGKVQKYSLLTNNFSFKYLIPQFINK